jgi:hypothetical protein
MACGDLGSGRRLDALKLRIVVFYQYFDDGFSMASVTCLGGGRAQMESGDKKKRLDLRK